MARLPIVMVMVMVTIQAHGLDRNDVFSPCLDAKVERFDGFSFGLAFASKASFFFNQTQLSPCDRRLPLAGSGAKLAVFRPKIDEISFLTIDGDTFDSNMDGGYMVAFSGRQYAARSMPVLVTDDTHIITSFTLVLEFGQGTLQNLFWKKFGCSSCPGKSVVCLDGQDCAVPLSECNSNTIKGGNVDCSLSIQLAFSGTDKYDNVLNSWYEVANLRQYSLYALYNNLQGSPNNPFQGLY